MKLTEWESDLGEALRGTGWTATWPRVSVNEDVGYAMAIHLETGRQVALLVICDFSTTKASRRQDIWKQLGIGSTA